MILREEELFYLVRVAKITFIHDISAKILSLSSYKIIYKQKKYKLNLFR